MIRVIRVTRATKVTRVIKVSKVKRGVRVIRLMRVIRVIRFTRVNRVILNTRVPQRLLGCHRDWQCPLETGSTIDRVQLSGGPGHIRKLHLLGF